MSKEQITQAGRAYYTHLLEEENSIRVEDGLWNDPAIGDMHHAVAGYAIAINCTKENNLNLPGILD